MISTPIGNLEDITYRAVKILKNVSLIAAEDTRHSKKLLSHYNINTDQVSYFEHNRYSRMPFLINYLNKGSDLALITDAGTPGISDPAYKLVRNAINHGIEVQSVPGVSAFLTALSSSGLPTDRFLFEGFLPPKKGRQKRLLKVQNEDATLIYYESPRRLYKTLNQLYLALGDRPAVVSRELTKMYEEIRRGTLSELCEYYLTHTLKGECVILIGKNDKNVYFN